MVSHLLCCASYELAVDFTDDSEVSRLRGRELLLKNGSDWIPEKGGGIYILTTESTEPLEVVRRRLEGDADMSWRATS
jgi:hypothetical protein